MPTKTACTFGLEFKYAKLYGEAFIRKSDDVDFFWRCCCCCEKYCTVKWDPGGVDLQQIY